jgi:hypothetical protein
MCRVPAERFRLADTEFARGLNGMITDFETDRRPLSPEAIAAIVAALAAAGVVFDWAGNAVKLRGVSGEGVRAAKPRGE